MDEFHYDGDISVEAARLIIERHENGRIVRLLHEILDRVAGQDAKDKAEADGADEAEPVITVRHVRTFDEEY